MWSRRTKANPDAVAGLLHERPRRGDAISCGKSTRPRIVVAALGVTQILAWGSSYYLLAVLARPIAARHRLAVRLGCRRDCRSACSRPASYRRASATRIEHRGGRPVLAVSAVPAGRSASSAWRSRRHCRSISPPGWCIGLGMGAGPLRRRLRHLGTALRPERAAGHRDPDLVRRIRQHRMLAALGHAGLSIRLARRLPRLCRHPAGARPAALPFRPSARARGRPLRHRRQGGLRHEPSARRSACRPTP